MSATAARVSPLHGLDHLADLLGRLHRALGQPPDLVRHHREALARVTRPRRLDRGVEREQVGLVGDALDHLDDLADLVRAVADRVDRVLQLLADAAGPRRPTAGSPRPPCAPGRRYDRRCRSCRQRAGRLLHRPEQHLAVLRGLVSVALICWIEAEVSSTLAASASAFRASACICAAISTMVEEVSSVELIWASAPWPSGSTRPRSPRRRWPPCGTRSDLADHLPEVLHHLAHRVLQPADLVPRLAA